MQKPSMNIVARSWMSKHCVKPRDWARLEKFWAPSGAANQIKTLSNLVMLILGRLLGHVMRAPDSDLMQIPNMGRMVHMRRKQTHDYFTTTLYYISRPINYPPANKGLPHPLPPYDQ